MCNNLAGCRERGASVSLGYGYWGILDFCPSLGLPCSPWRVKLAHCIDTYTDPCNICSWIENVVIVMCHFSPLLFLQNSQGGIAWIPVKQEANRKSSMKSYTKGSFVSCENSRTCEINIWSFVLMNSDTFLLCGTNSICALVLLFWEEYVIFQLLWIE